LFVGNYVESIDIEAAFLERDMDQNRPTFIEWPKGMLELRFITQEGYETTYIQLLKSMHGNIDAAIKFFKTYRKHIHLVVLLNIIQSRVDPCIFFKRSKEGKSSSLQ
jgi:hypothetical protein